MQPTLAIIAPAPGLLSINGRFCGELAPDMPLYAPVHPFGAVYLEYRPFTPGWTSMARRLVMSAGAPLADSLPEDIFAVRWPGGITELELAPEPSARTSVETLTLDGRLFRIHRGPDSFLETGALRCPFPQDGTTPQLTPFAGGFALIGAAGNERYLLTLSGDMSRQTGFLRADRIDLEPPDALRAITLKHDVAGHATLERWRLDAAGLQLISTESGWEEGLPRAPQSPEEAVRAAIEAALLGFFDEADSHLAPSLRAHFSLDAVGEICEQCLPMKYAPPEGRSCVGLLQIESGNLATVRPLYYQAALIDGRWAVTALEPGP